MSVLAHLRAFLSLHYFDPREFLQSLRHAYYNLFHAVRLRVGMANMASPVDSVVPSDNGEPLIRRMVHLKTKEECRLGDAVLQVWTVELPSKHAEGILKCVIPSSRYRPC